MAGSFTTTSGIIRPSDMCETTISYPGSPGPGGPAIVAAMVRANGKLDCDPESYGRYNGGFFHTDAIQSGKADVATLVFWNFEIPEARAKGMERPAFFSLWTTGCRIFCQLVLMTTPEQFEEIKPSFRKLVLAMRRDTRIIDQRQDLAREYYYKYVDKDSADETAQAIMEATVTATLSAFANDNNMSTEYYERLTAWLMETNQVDDVAASKVPVSTYWTNEIVW